MSTHLPRECEKLREHLPPYAEGKLFGRMRARLDHHLRSCERCANEVADLRTVIAAVRAVPAEQMPGDLVARVRQAVHERVPAPAAPGLIWARLAVPAAVLTGVIAIAVALRTPPVRQMDYRGAPPLRPVGVATSGGRARGTRPGGPAKLSDHAPRLYGRAARGGGQAPARAPRAWPTEEKLDAAPAPPSLDALPRPPSKRAEHEALSIAREEAASTRVEPAGARPEAPSPRDEADETAMVGEPGRPARAKEHGFSDERREAEAPPAPVSATVALASVESGKMVALRLTAQESLEEITLSLGGAPPRALTWQGVPGEPAWIPLPADAIGSGPGAIPITLEVRGATREYVLFVPVLARLGESAASAPAARYEGAPVRTVLADFSAFTGLVLLAERPLETELTGDLPSGKPAAVLEQLAGQLGFDLYRGDELAYTLTHPR